MIFLYDNEQWTTAEIPVSRDKETTNHEMNHGLDGEE